MKCPTGKRQHKTKEFAIIAQKKANNDSLNAYRCNTCNMWHLGTSRSPLRKMFRLNQLFDKVKK